MPSNPYDPRFAIVAGRAESTAAPVGPDVSICTVFFIGDDGGLFSAFLSPADAEALRAGAAGDNPAGFILDHELTEGAD